MGISYTTFSKTHKSSVCSISSSSANPPSAQKALGVILCVKQHARIAQRRRVYDPRQPGEARGNLEGGARSAARAAAPGRSNSCKGSKQTPPGAGPERRCHGSRRGRETAGARSRRGEPVGGSGAHRRRVSCAGAVGGARRRGITEAPPQEGGSRPLTAAVFWRQRVPPARQARTPPSRPFGFELPARGEGTGGGVGGRAKPWGEGGAGRARRARRERDKQPPTWLLPPRPPLLQYGLWRPRADEPRRVARGRLTPPRDAAPGG